MHYAENKAQRGKISEKRHDLTWGFQNKRQEWWVDGGEEERQKNRLGVGG